VDQSLFPAEIMPVLTPIGWIAHPFPRILNKSLNFAVQLAQKGCLRAQLGHRTAAGSACFHA
jgi:polyphosphate kinase